MCNFQVVSITFPHSKIHKRFSIVKETRIPELLNLRIKKHPAFAGCSLVVAMLHKVVCCVILLEWKSTVTVEFLPYFVDGVRLNRRLPNSPVNWRKGLGDVLLLDGK